MAKINMQRSSCKDTFNAFMVEHAEYEGIFDVPKIEPTQCVPNKMIEFSKSISTNDYNQWVHFYEDDYMFERLWKTPAKYLDNLKKFNGVILPDFSLYRDMPFVMQLWNIYRSRAIGVWLQYNNINVIPNIRFGDRRTFQICCSGIEKNSVIAIGSYGCLKSTEDRRIFLEGFESVLKQLEPQKIVVYGSTPDKYFKKYREQGYEIIQFDSSYAISRKEVV